jgi:hypothetical protein
MSDSEEDLRTTEDTLIADAGKLQKLETRKRRLGSDDAERVDLSDDIAKLGQRIERATAAEQDLARETAEG